MFKLHTLHPENSLILNPDSYRYFDSNPADTGEKGGAYFLPKPCSAVVEEDE